MQTWIIFALLGAAAAALTNIFAKVGMKGIDSTMATAVRSMVATIYLIGFTTVLGKWPHLKTLNPKALLMIVLAGLAGASSWLFEFRALAIGGPVSGVVALDKLSVPLAVVLAVLIFHERLLPLNWLGVLLIVAGGYLVAYKG
ncbi:MAG: EamA family transporter [Planctomycetota bacterium]|nr:EamA family transporter [Planctomycetota bacterium]